MKRELQKRPASSVDPAPSLGLAAASVAGGVALSFPRSRAAAYAPAVQICLGATAYEENAVAGVTYHFAHFAPTREDLGRALAAVSTLGNYRGLVVFAGGRQQEWARAQRVLQCFAQASACTDSRAHCQIMVHRASIERSPLGPSMSSLNLDFEAVRGAGQAMLFPCRLLAMSFGFTLQAGHPSSAADQIQAGAVREGCNWCPSFNDGREA